MAIYDFTKAEKTPTRSAEEREEPKASQLNRKDQIFSTIAARLFFLLLFLADLLWVSYALIRLMVGLIGSLVTGSKVPFFKKLQEKAWISTRRSLVCGVSLLVALFSPAFGIMIACTYFLMYDKSGIEEVVPSSLQSQFKEFLPQGQ